MSDARNCFGTHTSGPNERLLALIPWLACQDPGQTHPPASSPVTPATFAQVSTSGAPLLARKTLNKQVAAHALIRGQELGRSETIGDGLSHSLASVHDVSVARDEQVDRHVHESTQTHHVIIEV
jgi:hypothetical protein